MGYIKEPKGVDFIIKSKPLTAKEKTAISKFISDYKEKHTAKRVRGSGKIRGVKSKRRTLSRKAKTF